MAPFGLQGRSAEQVKGVYLPVYLYSATAHTSYHASIGERYQDNERKNRTEYRDVAGRHSTYVADIVVTASRGIPNDELEGIERFDLGSLARYTPALVSGWISEEPSLGREECRRMARQEATAHVERLVRGFLPGDSVRSLRHDIELTDESVDLTLVPVWVFAVRYDDEKPPIRVLVNGQTGKVFGKVPFSWAKLGLIAAGVLAVIGLLRLLPGCFNDDRRPRLRPLRQPHRGRRPPLPDLQRGGPGGRARGPTGAAGRGAPLRRLRRRGLLQRAGPGPEVRLLRVGPAPRDHHRPHGADPPLPPVHRDPSAGHRGLPAVAARARVLPSLGPGLDRAARVAEGPVVGGVGVPGRRPRLLGRRLEPRRTQGALGPPRRPDRDALPRHPGARDPGPVRVRDRAADRQLPARDRAASNPRAPTTKRSSSSSTCGARPPASGWPRRWDAWPRTG